VASVAEVIERYGVSTALDDSSIETMRVIQARYTTFLPFFRSIVRRYSSNKVLQDVLKETQSKISTVIRGIGALLTNRITDKEGVTNIFNLIDEIDDDIKNLSRITKEHEGFQEISSKVQEKTGVSVEELKTASGQLKKAKGRIKKERGIVKGVGKAIGETPLFGLGKEMVSGVLGAALGPFAGIGATIGKTALGVGRTIHGKMLERQRAKFVRGVTPMGVEVPKGYIESVRKSMGGGRDIGKYVDVRRGILPAEKKGMLPRIGKEGMPRIVDGAKAIYGRPMGKVSVKNAAEPIFYFFDKLAYKARWTKDVITLLKGRGGIVSAGVRKDSGLSNILTGLGLGGLLGKAGKIGTAALKVGRIGAGVTGALVGGYFLGKVIDKYIIQPFGEAWKKSDPIKKIGMTIGASLSSIGHVAFLERYIGKPIRGALKTGLGKLKGLVIGKKEKVGLDSKDRVRRSKELEETMAKNTNGMVTKYINSNKKVLTEVKNIVKKANGNNSNNSRVDNRMVEKMNEFIRTTNEGFKSMINEVKNLQGAASVGTGSYYKGIGDNELDAINRATADSED
jgi:hypothetical protein